VLLSMKVAELVQEAESRNCPIWEIVLEIEEKAQAADRDQLWQRMKERWEIMVSSVYEGLKPNLTSLSGLVGGEGAALLKYIRDKKTLSGTGSLTAAARAMGVAVYNAAMGKIVAAPTAGSCGILPAVLLTVLDRTGAAEDRAVGALFTAAGIGLIFDEIASTAGAEGGCQVECGAASCMAAAAAVEMAGGTPQQAANAGAIALKNVIGLTCDPVAGLVEIPCVKRNAMGAANALLAADMALAGIESKIPVDEVIVAIKEVAEIMPASLKETAEGGLANTPAAREIEKSLLTAEPSSVKNRNKWYNQ